MTNGDLENTRGPKPRGNNNNNGMYSGGYNGNSSASYYMGNSDSQWTSWLVPLIVVANVAMFIVVSWEVLFSTLEGKSTLWSLFSSKVETISNQDSSLEKLGGLEWNKVVHEHQRWRLITCIWLHAGVIHLLANMLSLVFIGIRLEQQFGFVRVGVIYLLSGIGGSILSSLFIQHSISVGASGALFGLLGAMLSELLTNWSIYSNKAAALFTLIFIVLINLAVGILPHVDNFAHIGGFMSGFLLGFILLPRPQFGWFERRHLPANARLKSKYTVYQYVLWVIATILLVIGFVVGLVMLFKGENGNDHCSWCHYLSCVPTSRWSCDN
ncbi:hypothetical protein Leryth_018295 [Lithospermum erythrorhizon]|nr:hypothetical protein Leryth_018295 [Lithospermum erythrorhizon]